MGKDNIGLPLVLATYQLQVSIDASGFFVAPQTFSTIINDAIKLPGTGSGSIPINGFAYLLLPSGFYPDGTAIIVDAFGTPLFKLVLKF